MQPSLCPYLEWLVMLLQTTPYPDHSKRERTHLHRREGWKWPQPWRLK